MVSMARNSGLTSLSGPAKYYVILKFADTPLHTFLERNKDGGR